MDKNQMPKLKTAVIASLLEPIDTKLLGAEVMKRFPNIKGFKVVHGPGCVNYGITLQDDDKATDTMNKLTMLMGPARWGWATDKPFTGITDER